MNNTTAENKIFCYDLPITIGNKTICGLTEKWKPRFNHGSLLAMAIIPVLVYWFILFKMVKKIYKSSVRIWRLNRKRNNSIPDFKEDYSYYSNVKNICEKDLKIKRKKRHQKRKTTSTLESSSKTRYQYLDGIQEMFNGNRSSTWLQRLSCTFECCKSLSSALSHLRESGILYTYKTYFTIVILTLVKYFWDAIDLTLDVYIFYRLERGNILDNAIYRNTHVNDAIYAFAILGCLIKIYAWVDLREQLADTDVNTRIMSENSLNRRKFEVGVLGFLFEDGPELILEYFYVEKYITSYTPLIIIKDAIISCLLVHTAAKAFVQSMRERNESSRYRLLNIFVIIFTLASMLRVGGSLYQYVTRKMRSCFVVADGRIHQSPFDVDCMRGIDYAILITVLIPLCGLVILFFVMGVFVENCKNFCLHICCPPAFKVKRKNLFSDY